jgi:hypothetical protein
MILFFVISGARPGAAGKVLATLFSVHAKNPFECAKAEHYGASNENPALF